MPFNTDRSGCLDVLRGFFYTNNMEQKTITNETLERVKTLPRFDYVAFQMLVTSKQVHCYIKFKKARTIFFDKETCNFLYLNPFHNELQICGKFIEETEVTNG